MKILGLITEYNPFHNGHKYHIEEAKKITGSDYVIVVMSGNFIQRGVPALLDKYSRTKMALESGASVVIELPVCYATASAESFAMGAVSILQRSGIVDSLCFGSECGDPKILQEIASFLINEPAEFKLILNQLLKTGLTYPAARSQALSSCLNDTTKDFTSVLTSPNNILGIEYMKALLKLNSPIIPYTILRKSTGYHDQSLDSSISSATAIRLAIENNASLDQIKEHVPEHSYKILMESFLKTFPVSADDFCLLFEYKLLSETMENLKKYMDVSPELAMRISNLSLKNFSYDKLTSEIKTKQVTLTRINRALLHILLNITKEQVMLYNAGGYAQYARLLGFRKSDSHLIRNIKDIGQIPVITKVADAGQILSPLAAAMLKEDIYASHVYNSVVYHKFKEVIKDEYTHGIILM